MRTIVEIVQLDDNIRLVITSASGQTFYVHAETEKEKSPEVIVSEFDGKLTFQMQGCDLQHE
jgi:hypothetical protein